MNNFYFNLPLRNKFLLLEFGFNNYVESYGKQYNTIAGKNNIHCISIDILSEFYVKINIFWVDSEWKISTLHDESIII